jgi:hypothetical protein
MPHPALSKGEGSKSAKSKSSPSERIIRWLYVFKGAHEGFAV